MQYYFFRPNGKLQKAWEEQTKNVYNFIKEEEARHDLPAPDDALPQLYTDGLDAEQVRVSLHFFLCEKRSFSSGIVYSCCQYSQMYKDFKQPVLTQ